jgi:opacity protein-like surface antigen
MKMFAVLAAALMLWAGPAFAADKPLLPAPAKKPARVPYDWSGAYAGGNVSPNQANSKWIDDTPAGSSSASRSTAPGFGVHAGYNYQFNSGLVFGSESSLSRSP